MCVCVVWCDCGGPDRQTEQQRKRASERDSAKKRRRQGGGKPWPGLGGIKKQRGERFPFFFIFFSMHYFLGPERNGWVCRASCCRGRASVPRSWVLCGVAVVLLLLFASPPSTTQLPVAPPTR